MEELFRSIASAVALTVEAGAVVLIAIGSIQAFVLGVPALIGRPHAPGLRRAAWQNFARWLVLALEFELAADIVRSAIAPTWAEIGQLAAIAVIRTFLNFFLAHDMEEVVKETGK
jgi:uncharacterized membrane protein